MVDKNLLADFFSIPVRSQKQRVWYYQHLDEPKQPIIKEGKWWYYNAPVVNGGGEVGCDSLSGAKGDLQSYSTTKIWAELI